MANYIVDGADLTSVANAIRAKSGGSGQLAFPAGFVSEIGNIPSGGGGGTGYTLLASGSYTYSGSATGFVNIPVTYTGTPVYAYAVADTIVPSTNQSYCFVILKNNFQFLPYMNNGAVGVVSAVNTSGVINTNAMNSSVNITSNTLTLSRVNNTYLIQPNTYNWYIYGVTT